MSSFTNPVASFGTTAFTPDALLVDTDDLLSRKVTIAAGAAHVRGEVLGKITASGKYALSAAAAADGSETPDAVLAHDVDATAADKEALCYFRARVNAAAVTLGAGHTADSIREGLRGKGIDLVPVQAA